MSINEIPVFNSNTIFRSLSKDIMSFNEVCQQIVSFIKSDPSSSYKLSVGTDSQVGNSTVFVSCIHVHRIGKGAIGFLHKCEVKRQIFNLREKIYLETCFSLQLAYLFNNEWIRAIKNAVNNIGKSRGVTFEFHIDVGTKGKTRKLINEMVGMVKGLEFIPRIKPDSYCASSFADRFTKAI